MNSENNDQTTNVESVDTSGGDDLLSSLVGEGKKFKTAADLARGKLEADTFIKKIQDENNALRALLKNSDELQRGTEIMENLLTRVSKGTLVEEQRAQPTPNESSNQSQALTSRDVEVLFKNLRQKEREDANEAAALAKLQTTYGDKTEEYLTKKASELNLDVAVVKATARKSPSAFFNLIGEHQLNNRNQMPSAARGTVNTSAVAELSNDYGLRNKKYYDKLQKEMGVKKFVLDRALQTQMHKDMTSLGDRWDTE